MLDKWLTHLRQDAPEEDNCTEHDSLQGNFKLTFTIPKSYFSTSYFHIYGSWVMLELTLNGQEKLKGEKLL